MPGKDALRQRIELVEGGFFGAPVRVLSMRMCLTHAVVDIVIKGVRYSNQRYYYRHYFSARQLRASV